MSEMIERVARALVISNGGDPDALNGASEVLWRLYEDDARAAIAAMREPTEAMVDAADELCPIARGTESHAISGGKVPEDYWRVMIDVAKAEGRS